MLLLIGDMGDVIDVASLAAVSARGRLPKTEHSVLVLSGLNDVLGTVLTTVIVWSASSDRLPVNIL